MKIVGRNISAIRESRGLGVSELARLAGLHKSGMSRIEGGTQTPSLEVLQKIAKALSVDPYVLLMANGNVENIPAVVCRVVFLGWDFVYDWIKTGLQNFDLSLLEYLPMDKVVSPKSFVVTVVGDSMAPTYLDGDTVVIDPEVQPRPGDCVVALDQEHKPTFKQYRDRGLGAGGQPQFELKPLNTMFASRFSDREPLEIVGTMVQHRRNRHP
jgi:transcriptional regulator with XRE-family HTH domain